MPEVGTWVADGTVTVVVDNSSGVNPGYGQQLNRVRLEVRGTPWLNLSPLSDTVAPGDSVIIDSAPLENCVSFC